MSPLGDMEWMIMPPLMLEQYRIFRGDAKVATEPPKPTAHPTPIGFALWALLSEEAEQKLNDAVMAGKGPVRLRPDEWRSGNRLWLIDLVAPFATEENKHVQMMLSDLVSNGLKQVRFKAKGDALNLHRWTPRMAREK